MKTASFVAFWIFAPLLVLDQIGWLYQAYLRPRAELRVLLGDVPDDIRIVGYHNGVGPHGGTILWNFDFSSQAAEGLRARCSGPGFLRPLEEGLSMRRLDRAVTQSQGCLIAGLTSKGGTYSEAVLQDHVLQLLVAM